MLHISVKIVLAPPNIMFGTRILASISPFFYGPCCWIFHRGMSMEPEMEKALLIRQYLGNVEILERAGIDVMHFSDEDLAKMSQNDLRHIVHQLRDLARTPRD